MAIPARSFARELLRKTDSEIAIIGTEWGNVSKSAAASLSTLSQSISYDRADVGAILEAVEFVKTLRERNPNAGPESVPRSGGHRMRFSNFRSFS